MTEDKAVIMSFVEEMYHYQIQVKLVSVSKH
jgi:hypothetical protein